VKNRKLYTIRAKRETTLDDGKYALHDAELLLYTRSEEHPDRIYGSQMEYDQNAGILRANGEVFMDLEPPQALTGSNAHPGTGVSDPADIRRSQAAPGQVIHVRTSGLIYVRKLGVASTGQNVYFDYGGMQCSALGAEFNSDQSTVRLLEDVHMDGFAHGQPLHLIAARADMNRNTDIAHITRPVVTSAERTAKADAAVLYLRRDGSIERIEGIDHVALTSGTQQVTANRLNAALTQESVLQSGRLTGDVALVDTDPQRPAHGSAEIVDALFDPRGSPAIVTASGAAKLFMLDRRGDPRGLSRSLQGSRIVAHFAPGNRRSTSVLKQLHATGSAQAEGESLATQPRGTRAVSGSAPAVKNIQIAADDLTVLFTVASNGGTQPQTLSGSGRTRLRQDAPLGEQETSSGDTLDMVFATQAALAPGSKAALEISSAVQTGHVSIRDHAPSRPRTIANVKSGDDGAVSTGTAGRAVYDGRLEKLTLTEDVHLYGNDASLIAPTVSLDQRTQDADASGGVQAEFQNTSAAPAQNTATASTVGGTSSAPDSADQITHILSASAHFVHDTRFATFSGTTAKPAQMWQGASQVQAATLFFDGVKRTFSARMDGPGGLVNAVFASAHGKAKPGTPSQAASIVRVSSPKMDYNDLTRNATFTEGVTIDGTMGEIRGKQAVVFLTPASPRTLPGTAGPARATGATPGILNAQPSPLNGSIDRVVIDGAVQITQPGRRGTGEQLLYTAATGSYVLTGSVSAPPRIVDAQQGSVTGKTLLFTDGGSTIVVAGGTGAPTAAGARVRTETRVGGSKEERQQTHENPRN
jgi:lipopolysaccharide export system protein LptA